MSFWAADLLAESDFHGAYLTRCSRCCGNLKSRELRYREPPLYLEEDFDCDGPSLSNPNDILKLK